MKTLFSIILATTLVGLVSFVGILAFRLRLNAKKITFYLISLASGTLLGNAFIHLMPEALDMNGPSALKQIAVGVFVFFILEKFLIWRHCHTHQRPEDHSRPVAAKMLLVGDTFHNFLDGVIIAGAFLTNPSLGMTVSLAIMFHEIPQELGDFGTLIHGGFTFPQAIWANGLTGMSSVLGGVATYFFFGTSTLVQTFVLPISAGGILYIALADLIPQLHEQIAPQETLLQILLLGAGFGLMAVLPH